jgi:hypothetical protein
LLSAGETKKFWAVGSELLEHSGVKSYVPVGFLGLTGSVGKGWELKLPAGDGVSERRARGYDDYDLFSCLPLPLQKSDNKPQATKVSNCDLSVVWVETMSCSVCLDLPLVCVWRGCHSHPSIITYQSTAWALNAARCVAGQVQCIQAEIEHARLHDQCTGYVARDEGGPGPRRRVSRCRCRVVSCRLYAPPAPGTTARESHDAECQ